MEILETPSERFENIPNYPFKENFAEFGEGNSLINIHYVDEGDESAIPILLMHGEPSWSFLYRNMIPPLVDAGYRVIAPDLMGFGKSSKPSSQKFHTYKRHVRLIENLLFELELDNIVLFCQDWGGLIGLRIAAKHEDIFGGIIAANTGFPNLGGFKGLIGNFLFKLRLKLKGKVTEEELEENPGFVNWVAYSQTTDDFNIGSIIQSATVSELKDKVIDAYEAPFPTNEYLAGPRVMPMLVPTELRSNAKLWDNVYSKWEKPFMTAFSDSDPITGGQEKIFQRQIPSAKNRDHPTIRNAGHFLQEDASDALVGQILKFIDKDIIQD